MYEDEYSHNAIMPREAFRRTTVDGQIEYHERRLQTLLEKQAEEENARNVFGVEDDWDEGSMIFFQREFPTGRVRRYSYVALKAGRFWYITGLNAGYKLTFDRLLREHLMQAARETGEVWRITQMEQL